MCSDIGLFVFAILCYSLAWAVSDCPQNKVMHKKVDMEVDQRATSTDRPQKPEFDLEKQLQALRKYATERNIAGTIRTFRSIQQAGCQMSSTTYNIVLQAFINTGNVQGAEDWMETILKAEQADNSSFEILIKALVDSCALENAKDLLQKMRTAGHTPSINIFEKLLEGYARARSLSESLLLLDEMHAQQVQITKTTLRIIEKLLNETRSIDQSLSRVRHVLKKFDLDGSTALADGTCISPESPTLAELPRLAAVIGADKPLFARCAHEVKVSGSYSQIKAVRKTLKQQGFLDETEQDAMPLDGHWETDDGLTVVIEGKIVRWGGKHASRLRFTGDDRRSCMLTLYGQPTKGQAASPAVGFSAAKTLQWDNGDTWQSYDGRAIGQDVLFSQSMTKTVRDQVQDEAYRAQSCAMLQCVSKQSLGLPVILEEHIVQFLGGDLYHVRINFQSKWNPSKPMEDNDDDLPLFQDGDANLCSSLSRRHPRVGVRHCWAEPSKDQCGQRTLVNGEEVDEDCFGRQIKAIRWA